MDHTKEQEREREVMLGIIDQPIDGLLYDLDLLPEQLDHQCDIARNRVITFMHTELSSLSAALAEKAAQLERLREALDIFASYECKRQVMVSDQWPPEGSYHSETCIENGKPHNEWCAVCRAREAIAATAPDVTK